MICIVCTEKVALGDIYPLPCDCNIHVRRGCIKLVARSVCTCGSRCSQCRQGTGHPAAIDYKSDGGDDSDDSDSDDSDDSDGSGGSGYAGSYMETQLWNNRRERGGADTTTHGPLWFGPSAQEARAARGIEEARAAEE